MTEPRADESSLRRAWAWAAALWLVVVLALAWHQVGFWRAPALDSDILALLPDEGNDPLLAAADGKLRDQTTRQVVVLIGDRDWSRARDAARVFQGSLAAQHAPLVAEVRADASAAALDFFRPYRDRLLTPEQRAQLPSSTPEALSERALSRLYAPGVSGGLSAWRDDPLGLWPDWWQARLGAGVGQRDGLASVSNGDMTWAILPMEASVSAFRLDGNATLRSALDTAEAAARQRSPGVRVLRAGVALHAEAAAVRASWEMNTIGWGSLIAVVVLMWLAFRGLRPVGLVALSLAIGWAAGVSVTVLVFGKLHLLTLVFGASLVGVAEDYGIHYFSCRQGHASMSSHGLMRYLLPGLFLAWVTSALAYLALGAAPFPGLRQMAVFSTAGLVAAFATVACWFPWLDQGPRPISAFGQWIASTLAPWPRWRVRGGLAWTGLIAVTVVTVIGLARLQVRDDLRSLQSSPPDLVAQQVEVGRLLGLPSPAQFYLVSGESVQQVLEREEALTTKLAALVADEHLGGFAATSDWVPSASRQATDGRVSRAAESQALAGVSTVVGEVLVRPQFPARPLRVDDWLRAPVSEPFRSRWLGEVDGRWASVVMLQGIGAHSDLALLSQQAKGLPGVRWVDRTGDISILLGRYRDQMGWLLVAGFAAVAVALFVRYRRPAWRALVPTLLATVLTLSALAWLGEPFQLFTVLALMLLLGMGVDYGIFLLEHPSDGASWLAVSLGAASTLLAFGLLALSATPALHTFGLTMLFGIGWVWLLSPFFRPADPAPAHLPSTGNDSA